MNILVATPGRLLQHMDQTFGFDAGNLQILGGFTSTSWYVCSSYSTVLDEADRILDMGFQKTLTALLGHLPKSRQTLLFSATQTDSVSDLARLSLKNPVQIGTKGSEGTSSRMPANLEQHYLLVELDKKLDVLWSFIKTHLQTKIIVFMSSCKQVRFVFETFCKMHPGMPLLNLHGKQKQSARLTMYQKFTSMSHAVLFATDIAARGLDFPSVDWVIQLDAPEDADTYIHRVGRTARYESKGKSLLFLLPNEEEGMVAALKKKDVEVSKIKNRASKTQNIQNQLQNLAFQDPEIKYLGQRVSAFHRQLSSEHTQKWCNSRPLYHTFALSTFTRTSQYSTWTSYPSTDSLNRLVFRERRKSSSLARLLSSNGRMHPGPWKLHRRMPRTRMTTKPQAGRLKMRTTKETRHHLPQTRKKSKKIPLRSRPNQPRLA